MISYYGMGERTPPLDELPFIPYGWSEGTPFNVGQNPLSGDELRAFFALRELGEPTLEQLDGVMRARGHSRAAIRDLTIDEFFQSRDYGQGYNNFLLHFAGKPSTFESAYLLRPATQRYQAAYGEHFELLQEIAGTKREEQRDLTDVERFEFFRAYQRMRHLVAESDPDYSIFGTEYLAV